MTDFVSLIQRLSAKPIFLLVGIVPTPKGRVIWPKYPEVLLLHYKQLGVDYPIVRSAELVEGLKSRDLEKGWGAHYAWSADEIRRNWERLKSLSGPIPGLGTLQYRKPESYNKLERTVLGSGLIDQDWYLEQYKDINPIHVDPALHFCIHGWKEGRKPNFYFDPAWYVRNYPEHSDEGRNPLFDYFTRGEKADACPSPHFNPKWYREMYGVDRNASALAHYLTHRRTGEVSPLPEFDVAAYCKDHPGTLVDGKDPFEASYIEQKQVD